MKLRRKREENMIFSQIHTTEKERIPCLRNEIIAKEQRK
jgi:hypothetical protein